MYKAKLQTVTASHVVEAFERLRETLQVADLALLHEGRTFRVLSAGLLPHDNLGAPAAAYETITRWIEGIQAYQWTARARARAKVMGL